MDDCVYFSFFRLFVVLTFAVNGREATRRAQFVHDALALGSKSAASVDPVHRAVQRLMRPAQVRRHQVGIVEMGESRSRMRGSRVEHRLGER